MEYITILIAILLVLAIADLVVGVSNDAVNFLQAAIGSRIAKRKVIFWIASFGIIIGATFSGGMMNIARNGVIFPESFFLSEILILFLAVMFTDVFLIDGYNTIGLPTSTTIAVVFELLGGALALLFLKSNWLQDSSTVFSDYVNFEKAFSIFAGILLSIFMAFVLGAFVQFFTRMVFTFRYKKRMRLLASIMGGIAISAIMFLIIKKGLSGAPFMNEEFSDYLNLYLVEIMLVTFTASAMLMLFLSFSFNVDTLKIVVFFGTFALALSFAANDLVNFIGIPLAAFEAFTIWVKSGSIPPSEFSLGFWSNGAFVHKAFGGGTYPILYLFSGIVMVITLFFSRKARTVTETEIHLGSQRLQYERFEPSLLSRTIVRNFISFYENIRLLIPVKLKEFIAKRLDRKSTESVNADEIAYFDSLRASVNLVVACLLISFGTYLKIPLSTTVVVFMVAMGTSLADLSWGRDSAVFRLTGVISVLNGWFLTACFAFVGAFVFTLLIWYGKLFAVIVIGGGVAHFLYRTGRIHKKKQKQKIHREETFKQEVVSGIAYLVDSGSEEVRKNLLEISKIFYLYLQGMMDEDIKRLREAYDKAELLKKEAKQNKSDLFYSFSQIPEGSIDSTHFFIQSLDYLSELINTIFLLVGPALEHYENNHRGLSSLQKKELSELLEDTTAFLNLLVHVGKEKKFDKLEEIIAKQQFILGTVDEIRKKQIRRIRSGEGKTRVTILFLETLAETRNVLLYSVNLIKSHRDFYISTRGSL